jgi:hypothetical protein
VRISTMNARSRSPAPSASCASISSSRSASNRRMPARMATSGTSPSSVQLSALRVNRFILVLFADLPDLDSRRCKRYNGGEKERLPITAIPRQLCRSRGFLGQNGGVDEFFCSLAQLLRFVSSHSNMEAATFFNWRPARNSPRFPSVGSRRLSTSAGESSASERPIHSMIPSMSAHDNAHHRRISLTIRPSTSSIVTPPARLPDVPAARFRRRR